MSKDFLFPVLLLEVSHKFHQFPNTLRRHCIVNAGAHAAQFCVLSDSQSPLPLTPSQTGRPVPRPRYKGHVHQ